MFECYRGWYKGKGKFITNRGGTLYIGMFPSMLEEYKDKIPFEAYVQLEGQVIRNIVLISH